MPVRSILFRPVGSLLACFVGLAVGGESPNRLHDGWLIDYDARVVVGLATAVDGADVRGLPATAGASADQRLDAKWLAGPHLGLRVDRIGLKLGKWGWLVGVEGAYDRHLGTVDSVRSTGAGNTGPAYASGGQLQLDAASVVVHVGPVLRVDDDDDLLRVFPRLLQFELTGHLGGGGARGRIAGGPWSSWGWYGTYGAELAGHVHLGDGLTAGLAVGYSESTVDLRFANTRNGTWSASGLTATLQIGQRF
ncbi:hypothetical protein LBMAG53_01170 [Planctomycetota bacterium]|nr:hypothetical protein LBMAG53_01170 [Planctomycetota bacterium]